jgi:hypothetical protein
MEKQFIKNWIIKNSANYEKIFPQDFLSDEKLTNIKCPKSSLF